MNRVCLIRVQVAIGALWLGNCSKDCIHLPMLLANGLSINTVSSVNIQITLGSCTISFGACVIWYILLHRNIILVYLILDSPYVEMAHLFNFLRNLLFDNMVAKILQHLQIFAITRFASTNNPIFQLPVNFVFEG